MPTRVASTSAEGTAEIAHAIPGRLRLCIVRAAWTDEELVALTTALDGLRARRGIRDVELRPATRTVLIRYDPDLLDQDAVLAHAARIGLTPGAPAPPAADGYAAHEPAPALSERTEELAALIGVPTSFDRRLLENLALSGVSLIAARTVAQAVGGGTTIVAYFAIWFVLRRATGLGQRR